MEKISIRDALRRVLVMCFSLVFATFGTVLFYLSDAGSMPLAALHRAIHLRTGLSFTLIHWSFNLIFLVYFLIRDRRFIHIGTLISFIVPGMLIDLWNYLLTDFYAMDFGLWGYILLPLLGAVFMGIGQSIWYPASIGTGPVDMPIMALQAKGWSFQKAYNSMQAIWLTLALLMGGAFGWGTIVGFAFQGSVTGFFMRYSKPRLYPFCHCYDKMAQEGMISQEEADRLMEEHRLAQAKA